MEAEFIGFVVGVVFAAILFLFVITMVILILFGFKLGRRKDIIPDNSSCSKNADERLSDATASLMINRHYD